ncbi:synaptonemal complex protein 1-like [Protopterus annectens]|uniref:synaptonemal complex protein 1-like n=1 Tax=Protopterus annectens TaxID=7888 RepID=UPI001CFBE87E|nr:synaptonemal complex protein 1-like [Protopterus annectens]
MMSWDLQLNSILSATDSNVEKIRQRLNTSRSVSKGFMLDKMGIKEFRLSEPEVSSPKPSFLYMDIQSQKSSVESRSLPNSSLEMQTKVIESLSQAVQRLEKEKEQQQHRIRKLEEEVLQLRLQSYPDDISSLLRLETKVNEWRREISNEIFSLREKLHYQTERDLNKNFDNIMEDVNQSKKLLWEESASLRREIDYLKHRLKRQEEDLRSHISEIQNLKRSHDRNSETLMDLMDSSRSHSSVAIKTHAVNMQKEQELKNIRHEVEELRRQLKIHLEDKQYSKPVKGGKPGKVKKHKTRDPPQFLPENEDSASVLSLGDIHSDDSSLLTVLDLEPKSRSSKLKKHKTKNLPQFIAENEDSSSVLSLGDISSDDSSFLTVLDLEPNPTANLKRRARSTLLLEKSENGQVGCIQKEDDEYAVSSDLDGLSDSPELTFSDL